jgi:hypothetical protein
MLAKKQRPSALRKARLLGSTCQKSGWGSLQIEGRFHPAPWKSASKGFLEI